MVDARLFIKFYPIPPGNLTPAMCLSSLFLYPNNKQHFRYHHSTGASSFDIVSLFSWTNGFGIIVSTYNNQYVLILPANPPGCAPSHWSSLETFFARSMQAGKIQKNMGYESVSTLSTEDTQNWKFWHSLLPMRSIRNGWSIVSKQMPPWIIRFSRVQWCPTQSCLQTRVSIGSSLPSGGTNVLGVCSHRSSSDYLCRHSSSSRSLSQADLK